ncbi:MAG: hypothetical protein AAF518_02285 [Spirochaetota bacterium]
MQLGKAERYTFAAIHDVSIAETDRRKPYVVEMLLKNGKKFSLEGFGSHRSAVIYANVLREILGMQAYQVPGG